MLHPDTELKYVSDTVGYGIYATKDIPMGTVTWASDQLDRIFTQDEVSSMSEHTRNNLLKYTYRNRQGLYIFCWDLTRYINHSHDPNCMLTSLGFEIAIRNIRAGDEMTNDYGTLNIIEPFRCAYTSNADREWVMPDDLTRMHPKWDEQIGRAFPHILRVPQPLYKFLSPDTLTLIREILDGNLMIPSVLENFYSK